MKPKKITKIMNDVSLKFFPPGEVDWKKYSMQYDAVTMDLNEEYRKVLSLPFMPIFEKTFDYKNNKTICDLGAGTGNFSIPFAKKYPLINVYHLDSDELSLSIAKEKAKGIKNISFIQADAESIKKISEESSIKFDTVFMFHSLYSTRSKTDTEKPKRILENILKSSNKNGGLFISDIEREMNLARLIAYSTLSSIKKYGIKESINKFKKLDQAKIQNSNIVRNQRNKEYIVQNLDGLIDLVKSAGYETKNIFFKSDKYYFGYDNTIALKN